MTSINFPKSAEATIFKIGCISIVGLISYLVSSYWWIPGKAHLLVTAAVLHFSCGRLVSIFFGLSTGLSYIVVIPVNILVDTIWVFILYPLVIFSLKKVISIRYVKQRSKLIEKIAQKYRVKIEQYGPLGLYCFVFIPLPMTGPIAGGVIGYFMQLRPVVNMTVVLAGAYTTIAFWVMFLPQVVHFSQTYSSRTPFLLLSALIIVSILVRLQRKQGEGVKGLEDERE